MLRSCSLIGEVAVMIVTRQYAITYDAVREVYKIQSEEVPICPKCGAVMAGHGIRRRHAIDSSGTSRWFELRRWRCPAVCRSSDSLPLAFRFFRSSRTRFDARLRSCRPP